MTRPDWQNLNGEWQLAPVDHRRQPRRRPDAAGAGPRAVPGGVGAVRHQAAATTTAYLFYRRTFTVPAGWAGRRVQLHFGAVDWQATVWVNGVQVGGHTGGYDRFDVDITARSSTAARNELIVGAYDPTDTGAAEPGPRQAGPQPGRHLVHAVVRHLADGVDGAVAAVVASAASTSTPTSPTTRCGVRVFTRGDVTGRRRCVAEA